MSIDASNYIVFGRRTSMRLTAQEVEAMQAICMAENIDKNQFCEQAITQFSGSELNNTQRVKAAILSYFYERAEFHANDEPRAQSVA